MPHYVRQSAKLRCTMGSAQSALQLSHPANPVLLCGTPMAGVADSKPMANIAPFGLCKSLANPTVSAATAAAGGKLQEMPCIPAVTSPWVYAKMNVFVKGQPAVMNDSRCVCMWLGIIKVADAGQKSVIDTALPPPFLTAEPKPPAPAAAPTPKAKTPKKTPQKTQAQTPKTGPLASIQAAIKAAIEKAVNTVKGRVAAVASSVAAAVTAAVGGIFGLRGKGEEAEAEGSRDVTAVNKEAGTEAWEKTEDKKAAKEAARRKKEEERAAKKEAKEEARRKKNEEKTAKKEATEEAKRKKSEEKAAKKAQKKTAPESETPTEEAPSTATAPTKADGGNARQNASPIAKTAIVARLTRDYLGRRITFGTFEVFLNGELKFKCDSCEDVVRGNGNSDTVDDWKIIAESAIPYGDYTCIQADGESRHAKNKRWLVNNVRGYRGIRIHDGLTEAYTDGCILLGERNKERTALLNTSEAITNNFDAFIKEHGNQNFTLRIPAPQPTDAEIMAKQKAFKLELETAYKANVAGLGTCFCNGDFKPNDLRTIIYRLRDIETSVIECLFSKYNCYIPEEEKTIERLTEEINRTCRKYHIDTCIQKIHFLSQIYHESDRFRTTLEYKTGDNYELGRHDEAGKHDHTVAGDGPKYKGKGLIQLTWRDAQLTYLKSVKNTHEVLKNIKHIIDKQKTSSSIWVANKDIIGNKNYASTDAKVDAIIDRRSNNYERIICDTLSAAVDSAGWYWSEHKKIPYMVDGIYGKTLNDAALFADDHQEIITKTLNGSDLAKKERKMYYDALKKIMNVHKCTNKSTYKGALS